MKKALLLFSLILLFLCFSLASSTENQTSVLSEPLMDNQALGFVCQGEFKVLAPQNLHQNSLLTLFSTRMQEATAPIEVDLHAFEGEFVTITWQVSDGETFWGVDIAPVYKDSLIDFPFK